MGRKNRKKGGFAQAYNEADAEGTTTANETVNEDPDTSKSPHVEAHVEEVPVSAAGALPPRPETPHKGAAFPVEETRVSGGIDEEVDHTGGADFGDDFGEETEPERKRGPLLASPFAEPEDHDDQIVVKGPRGQMDQGELEMLDVDHTPGDHHDASDSAEPPAGAQQETILNLRSQVSDLTEENEELQVRIRFLEVRLADATPRGPRLVVEEKGTQTVSPEDEILQAFQAARQAACIDIPLDLSEQDLSDKLARKMQLLQKILTVVPSGGAEPDGAGSVRSPAAGISSTLASDESGAPEVLRFLLKRDGSVVREELMEQAVTDLARFRDFLDVKSASLAFLALYWRPDGCSGGSVGEQLLDADSIMINTNVVQAVQTVKRTAAVLLDADMWEGGKSLLEKRLEVLHHLMPFLSKIDGGLQEQSFFRDGIYRICRLALEDNLFAGEKRRACEVLLALGFSHARAFSANAELLLVLDKFASSASLLSLGTSSSGTASSGSSLAVVGGTVEQENLVSSHNINRLSSKQLLSRVVTELLGQDLKLCLWVLYTAVMAGAEQNAPSDQLVLLALIEVRSLLDVGLIYAVTK